MGTLINSGFEATECGRTYSTDRPRADNKLRTTLQSINLRSDRQQEGGSGVSNMATSTLTIVLS